MVIGPNGNSIFLPAAGDREGMSLEDGGLYGYYWSSMPYDDLHAFYLGVGHSYLGVSRWYRYYGHSVRPVKEKRV